MAVAPVASVTPLCLSVLLTRFNTPSGVFQNKPIHFPLSLVSSQNYYFTLMIRGGSVESLKPSASKRWRLIDFLPLSPAIKESFPVCCFSGSPPAASTVKCFPQTKSQSDWYRITARRTSLVYEIVISNFFVSLVTVSTCYILSTYFPPDMGFGLKMTSDQIRGFFSYPLGTAVCPLVVFRALRPLSGCNKCFANI
jgi:hypothetical protein